MNASARPRNARAVMASRQEPPNSLDYFPTPPWAARALVEHVLRPMGVADGLSRQSCWEPAAGGGHLVAGLSEYFGRMIGSDIFDYGAGFEVLDFLDPAARARRRPWIITNPPFGVAGEFAALALEQADVGVAVLVRTQWLHTKDRYETIFSKRPPAAIGLFVERVAMARGVWIPGGTTATDYSWICWISGWNEPTRAIWIPPCKAALTRQSDIERFAAVAEAPLLDAAAAE